MTDTSGSNPLRVPEAPTFWPTEDDWEQPLRYLASIRSVAEPYGICKIVPPKGWSPPLALSLQSLVFSTRVQKVHELQHRDFYKAQLDFYEDYDRFLQAHGKALCKWKYPQLLGKDVDIYVLYRAVNRRGGYEAVTEQKKWKEVAKVLQISEKGQTSMAYGMRQMYVKHLLPYEDWKHGTGAAEAAMAAVQAEAEAEGAGRLSQPCSEELPDVEPEPDGQPDRVLLPPPAAAEPAGGLDPLISAPLPVKAEPRLAPAVAPVGQGLTGGVPSRQSHGVAPPALQQRPAQLSPPPLESPPPPSAFQSLPEQQLSTPGRQPATQAAAAAAGPQPLLQPPQPQPSHPRLQPPPQVSPQAASQSLWDMLLKPKQQRLGANGAEAAQRPDLGVLPPTWTDGEGGLGKRRRSPSPDLDQTDDQPPAVGRPAFADLPSVPSLGAASPTASPDPPPAAAPAAAPAAGSAAQSIPASAPAEAPATTTAAVPATSPDGAASPASASVGLGRSQRQRQRPRGHEDYEFTSLVRGSGSQKQQQQQQPAAAGAPAAAPAQDSVSPMQVDPRPPKPTGGLKAVAAKAQGRPAGGVPGAERKKPRSALQTAGSQPLQRSEAPQEQPVQPKSKRKQAQLAELERMRDEEADMAEAVEILELMMRNAKAAEEGLPPPPPPQQQPQQQRAPVAKRRKLVGGARANGDGGGMARTHSPSPSLSPTGKPRPKVKPRIPSAGGGGVAKQLLPGHQPGRRAGAPTSAMLQAAKAAAGRKPGRGGSGGSASGGGAGGGKAADVSTSPVSDVPEDINSLVCEVCAGGHAEDQILLCDRCDRGFHLFCLSPPLPTVPEGEWLCPRCRKEETENYAFAEGDDMTFAEFERHANHFKRTYWGSEAKSKKVSWEEIEEEFWRLVDEAEDQVEVLYGADLDSGELGSGFPRPASGPADKQTAAAAAYASHPWNLNNIPRLQGVHPSLLRHLSEPITGITVPWLYVGMLFSAFCWHVEDHLLYSINYNHFGDPKRWYAVPAASREAFEAAFRAALPNQFEAQPDLLLQLVTMVSPRTLQAAGVPLYALTQEEGEFVVTWPGAYHAGFNHGLNCAEAVNFAPPDWLRMAGAAEERYRFYRKQPVINQHELLLKVARAEASPHVAAFVAPEMRRVAQEEHRARLALWAQGVTRSRRVKVDEGMYAGPRRPKSAKAPRKGRKQRRPGAGGSKGSGGAASSGSGAGGAGAGGEEEECCTVCHCWLQLSGVECDCCPGRLACCLHGDQLCGCAPGRRRLLYRYSVRELEQMAAEVSSRLPPDAVKEEQLALTAVKTNGAAASAPGPARALEGGQAGPSASSEAAVAAAAPATAVTCAPADAIATAMEEDGEAAGQQGSDGVDALVKLEPGVDGRPVANGVGGGALGAIVPAAVGVVRSGAVVASSGELSELIALHRAAAEAYAQRIRTLLRSGSARQSEVELAMAGAEQFLWAGAQADVAREAEQQCRRALEWGEEAAACAVGRPRMGALEAVLAAEPPPIALPVLARLREMRRGADAWRSRYAALMSAGGGGAGGGGEGGAGLAAGGGKADERLVPIEALEELAEAASSLQVDVPEVAELQQRIVAGRGLMEMVRIVLGPAAAGLPPATTTVPEAPRAHASAADGATDVAPAADGAVDDAPPAGGDASADAGSAVVVAAADAVAAAVAAPVVTTLADTLSLPPEQRPSLSQLRQLAAQVSSCRVAVPALAGLAALVERAEGVVAAGKALLRTKAPLERLRGYVEEVAALPAYLPEVKSVVDLLDKATEWLRRAAEARTAQPPPSLKNLRQLLHSGERMAVVMPEAEALRAAIRRREWEEGARRMLSGAVAAKTSLNALSEALGEAAAMGAEGGEVYEALKARVAAAQAWDRRVQALLAIDAASLTDADKAPEAGVEVGGPPGAEAGAMSEAAAQAGPQPEAAQEPEQRPVGPPEVVMEGVEAQRDGAAAGGGEASPSSCRPSGADAAAAGGSAGSVAEVAAVPRSMAELEELVAEGSRLGLRLERLPVVQRLLECAREWVEVAEHLIANADRGVRPCMEDLSTTLTEAAALGFAYAALPRPLLVRLRRLLEGAALWRVRAAALLAEPPNEAAAAEAAALVEEYDELVLDFPEGGRLRCWLEALRWNKHVATTFALVFEQPEADEAEAEAARLAAEAEAAAALAMVAAAAEAAHAAGAAEAAAVAAAGPAHEAPAAVGEQLQQQAGDVDRGRERHQDGVPVGEAVAPGSSSGGGDAEEHKQRQVQAGDATHAAAAADALPNGRAEEDLLAAMLCDSPTASVEADGNGRGGGAANADTDTSATAAAAAAAHTVDAAANSGVDEAAAAAAAAVKAVGEARAAATAAAEAKAAAVAARRARRAPLRAARAALDRAAVLRLPVDQAMREALSAAVVETTAFEMRVRARLASAQASDDDYVPLAEAEVAAWVADSDRLLLEPDTLATLEALLTEHRTRLGQLRLFLSPDGPRAPLPVLAAARKDALASPLDVDPALIDAADEAIEAVEEWRDLMRRTFLKQKINLNNKVERCLAAILATVALALVGLSRLAPVQRAGLLAGWVAGQGEDIEEIEVEEPEQAKGQGQQGQEGQEHGQQQPQGAGEGAAAACGGGGAAGMRRAVVVRSYGARMPPASEALLQLQSLPPEALGGVSRGGPHAPPLLCLCQSTAGADDALMQCEGCGDIYHHRCAGLSVAAARNSKRWSCPICAAAGDRNVQNPLPSLDALCNRFRRTRRPSPAELDALIAGGEALRAEVHELEPLRAAREEFRLWEHAARRVISGHANLMDAHAPDIRPRPDAGNGTAAGAAAANGASGATGTGGASGSRTGASRQQQQQQLVLPELPQPPELMASASAVREVIKQACVMEVDASAVAAPAMELLRVQAWRNRTAQILQGPAKVSVDFATKTAREAQAMGVPAEDPVYRTLNELIAGVEAWQQRCHGLMEQLRPWAGKEALTAELSALLAEAKGHLDAAARLPFKVDRDVEKLSEVSAVYCLCRKLYNEEEPMVACDYCDEWFHHRCVGLRRPVGANEDSYKGRTTRGKPDDYKCPRCCAREHQPYPREAYMPPSMAEAMRLLRHQFPKPPTLYPPRLPQPHASGPAPGPLTTHPFGPPLELLQLQQLQQQQGLHLQLQLQDRSRSNSIPAPDGGPPIEVVEAPRRRSKQERERSLPMNGGRTLAAAAKQRDIMLQQQQQAAAASAAAAAAAAAHAKVQAQFTAAMAGGGLMGMDNFDMLRDFHGSAMHGGGNGLQGPMLGGMQGLLPAGLGAGVGGGSGGPLASSSWTAAAATAVGGTGSAGADVTGQGTAAAAASAAATASANANAAAGGAGSGSNAAGGSTADPAVLERWAKLEAMERQAREEKNRMLAASLQRTQALTAGAGLQMAAANVMGGGLGAGGMGMGMTMGSGGFGMGTNQLGLGAGGLGLGVGGLGLGGGAGLGGVGGLGLGGGAGLGGVGGLGGAGGLAGGLGLGGGLVGLGGATGLGGGLGLGLGPGQGLAGGMGLGGAGGLSGAGGLAGVSGLAGGVGLTGMGSMGPGGLGLGGFGASTASASAAASSAPAVGGTDSGGMWGGLSAQQHQQLAAVIMSSRTGIAGAAGQNGGGAGQLGTGLGQQQQQLLGQGQLLGADPYHQLQQIQQIQQLQLQQQQLQQHLQQQQFQQQQQSGHMGGDMMNMS
ncbi:hypothetical protein GPECTOR_35g844 [Gonium pectorale]|uniref:[Histone H3]-trimethyl-L-lysine(4) demethylase n=1 Tax=Gonium pectorale TaxID=33097 RepID=A0A150GC26_GONPE|nr:hypothetical protein GPECTOR_35g844 [Gonium pectorale]|eukprot:KXZ47406.1 hypothetical protein GPECTOR_35g844 [Gonium pectorale]